MTQSPEQLVRACLDGDQSAWHALVDHYRNLVYSIPMRMGFSADEASDVFQTTFVEVFRGLPSLREPRAVTKWIIQIAVHECQKERRRRSAVFDELDAKNLDAAFDEDAAPEAHLLALERDQALRECLEALPARCQELIRMLFFEGRARPYSEIAASLGLAVGSLGFIRGRCLEKLRRQLTASGFSS